MKRIKLIISLGAIVLFIIVGNIFINLSSLRSIDFAHSYISNEHANEAKKTSNFEKGNNIEHALQDSIEIAMDDYKDKMRFPIYSIPIDNNDWNILNPRVFEPIPKAIFNDEGFISSLSDIKVSLEIENFIVNVDHDLPVKVKIVTEIQNTNVDLAMVSIMLKSSNNPYGDSYSNDTKDRYNSYQGEKIILQKTIQNSDAQSLGNASEFSGVIPSLVLQSFGESNVHIIAELIFSDGTEAMTGAAIKLFESTASLEKIGNAYVDGPHLIIPVDLFAQIPGYFRIQANLFDETGKLPIAHLTEEINSDQAGLISGEFKAHIVTLKKQGNQGPYLLKNINISKIPTKPDYRPRYGNYETASYAIEGFNFAHYKDEEYVNPDMVKRLAALKKITNQN